MKKQEKLKQINYTGYGKKNTEFSSTGSEIDLGEKFISFHNNPVLPPIQATRITTNYRDGSHGCDTFNDATFNRDTQRWPASDLISATAGYCS